MQSLLQTQVRQDIQSIENSHYNEQFSKQIQALLEYGMYEYAFNRVSQYKEQILEDLDILIDLTRKFNKFKQHKYALEILKFTNIFDKQLDISPNQQQIIFKQYYIETLVEIQDINTVLNETKNIYNDQIRNMIQEDLHQLQNQRRGSFHSQVHQNQQNAYHQLEIKIPNKIKKKFYQKQYFYIFVALIILFALTIYKKDKLKQLIIKLKQLIIKLILKN